MRRIVQTDESFLICRSITGIFRYHTLDKNKFVLAVTTYQSVYRTHRLSEAFIKAFPQINKHLSELYEAVFKDFIINSAHPSAISFQIPLYKGTGKTQSEARIHQKIFQEFNVHSVLNQLIKRKKIVISYHLLMVHICWKVETKNILPHPR